MDFLYSDKARTQHRHYNYIVATENELLRGIWGSVLEKASQKVECGPYSIFIYQDESSLLSFLFPWGVPRDLDGNGNINNTEHKHKVTQVSESSNVLKLPAIDLFTEVGQHKNKRIIAAGKTGFLVYGPYVDLPPGHFVLTVYGNLISNDAKAGLFDVVSNGGVNIIAKQQIDLSNMDRLDKFSLVEERKIAVVEFNFIINHK
jgi:hypothetical protein